MILEVKMRSRGTESLKRPPSQFGNCFPLKKRRIKYEEINSDLAAITNNEPLHLEISTEPENLSTKPEDLSLAARRNVDPPSPVQPTQTIKKESYEAPSFPIESSSVYPPKGPTAGPLEPINFNQPTWSHHSLFTPYNPRNHQQFFAPPNHTHHYPPKREFILPHDSSAHDQMAQYRPIPMRPSPPAKHFEMIHPTQVKTEVMRLSELGTVTHRIKVETEDTLRSLPVRDSVISHSNSQAQSFHPSTTSQYRETVSRSSCDSGVSSPSGSSCHSSCSAVSGTVVNGTVRYQCPNCSKSYSTVSGLSKHVQFHCSVAVKKSFVCKDCDKVYVSLGALKMHIRTHTLPCKCTVCGKAFSRPWLLQGHLRTHTGEKPFACSHCHRAFADRSNLRAHLQTHSEVKKYSCSRCAKTFSRMSLLTKHEESGCFTSM